MGRSHQFKATSVNPVRRSSTQNANTPVEIRKCFKAVLPEFGGQSYSLGALNAPKTFPNARHRELHLQRRDTIAKPQRSRTCSYWTTPSVPTTTDSGRS